MLTNDEAIHLIQNPVLQGRLTMADGLWFAQEHAKVEAVIDIATLVRPAAWPVAAPARWFVGYYSRSGPQSIISADQFVRSVAQDSSLRINSTCIVLVRLALQFAC